VRACVHVCLREQNFLHNTMLAPEEKHDTCIR